MACIDYIWGVCVLVEVVATVMIYKLHNLYKVEGKRYNNEIVRMKKRIPKL